MTVPVCLAALLALLPSLRAWGAPADVAPDREFDRIAQAFAREAPSQDLVDRFYDFMEKWPRDPRGDRAQYWVGITQQRRNYHNQAIKELEYVISEFPSSPLVILALRAQINSYVAVNQGDKVAGLYARIYALKPRDLAADAAATAAFRDALLYLADRRLEQKQVDAAIALYAELPDRQEVLSRTVSTYIAHDRHEDVMKLIRRLPPADKMLGYSLSLRVYASRPGTANLYNLMNEVLAKEPAGEAIDALVQQIAQTIGSRSADESHKVFEYVSTKYPRLRRWAHYGLCGLHRGEIQRLLTFVSDYRTGTDVEQTKTWIGEAHEASGAPAKAREAYWRLDDRVTAHFRVAQTYYGPRAKTKDLPGGERELTEIVKRFYSAATSCEALSMRAELQAGPMGRPDLAMATLRELIDRFADQAGPASAALMRLAALLREGRKFDQAIACYEKLIVNYPSSGHVRRAWLEVAACHEELNDPQRAIAVLKTVLRKFPRTGEASFAHTRLETRYKIADTDVSDK